MPQQPGQQMPLAQTLLQAPQFFGSVLLTHAELQQSCPGWQMKPHLPQFIGSLDRSKQPPPPAVAGPMQQVVLPPHAGPLLQAQPIGVQLLPLVQEQPPDMHWPIWQLWPLAQPLVQLPQWPLSLDRSKQPAPAQQL